MQTTDTILMIRPINFGSNPDSIVDNYFQAEAEVDESMLVAKKAIVEFDKMVDVLREHDVNVLVFEDTETPLTPDSIFPNNWFSTHAEGIIATYAMKPENRRKEKRKDIIESLQNEYGLSKLYNFDYLEEEGQFLEGTGSMVLDRENKIAYACLSNRTDIRTLEKFCILFGYRKVIFHAFDEEQRAIYHTNVMMAICDKYAVICLESILDDNERTNLIENIKVSGKKLIDISLSQMNNFAGNVLQVKNKLGLNHLVLSKRAYESLDETQLDAIKTYNPLIIPDIEIIERYGGGGVRCMMAEIFYS